MSTMVLTRFLAGAVGFALATAMAVPVAAHSLKELEGQLGDREKYRVTVDTQARVREL